MNGSWITMIIVPEYEGKIIYGDMEYEFTIDANTGEILEWDMDSVYD